VNHDLSATMKTALTEEDRQRKEKQWLEENRQAIAINLHPAEL